MKRTLISLAIGLAIFLAVYFFTGQANTAGKLRYSLGAIKGKLSISDGLTLDITMKIDNPTDMTVSVQNVDLVGTLNGNSAGAIVPGQYSADIKARSTTDLTVKYNIPIISLVSLLGTNIATITAKVIAGDFKGILKGFVLQIDGTIKALNINIPISEKFDLGEMVSF